MNRTILALLLGCVAAVAQPLPPVTTPYTRDFLRVTSQSNAWYFLNITETNLTSVTNWSDVPGPMGITPTILITNTETGVAGSSALVTNLGDSTNLLLRFTVPVGAKGTCCQCSTKVSCIESNIITAENGLRYLYCYWCKIDWNVDEEWYEYHK